MRFEARPNVNGSLVERQHASTDTLRPEVAKKYRLWFSFSPEISVIERCLLEAGKIIISYSSI